VCARGIERLRTFIVRHSCGVGIVSSPLRALLLQAVGFSQRLFPLHFCFSLCFSENRSSGSGSGTRDSVGLALRTAHLCALERLDCLTQSPRFCCRARRRFVSSSSRSDCHGLCPSSSLSRRGRRAVDSGLEVCNRRVGVRREERVSVAANGVSASTVRVKLLERRVTLALGVNVPPHLLASGFLLCRTVKHGVSSCRACGGSGGRCDRKQLAPWCCCC
jgi:hypothetical protein